MPTGKVKWFNNRKKIGFITPDDYGYALFVQEEHVTGGILTKDEKVIYEISQGQKGPYAKKVRPLNIASIPLKDRVN